MNLQSKEYSLRTFKPSDLENVFLGLSNPEVIKYYGVSYKTLEDTQKQMDWFAEIENQNTGRWRAIISLSTNKFCGAIGFNNWSHDHRKAEMGYWLLPPYWGKGIMRDVLPLMISFGFQEMKLHRIEAEVETENTASKKLLLSQGFIHEGTKRDCEIKNGQFIGLDIFSLLAE